MYFPFLARKSANTMIFDFGRNADEKIVMNPWRAIRSPGPQVTTIRLKS